VLFVAIGFTLALDFVGSAFSSAYSNPALIPQDSFVLRLIVNLIGIQGIWGYRIQLGSNPALWSVGYEFVYYILFGILYFREKIFNRSWYGVVLVIFILGIVGWKMAAYFSIWMTGVTAYYASNFDMVKKYKLSVWLVTAMIFLANHLILYLNIFGATEVISDIAFAIVIAILLTFEVKHKILYFKIGQKINTYMADFSYSIYAFHTPVIFLGCSLLFNYGDYLIPSLVSGLIMVTVSISIARILFYMTELRRNKFRLIADQCMRRIGI
jgi:peptidoglycan/LPS O-acetylase OafA/YrhL